MGMTNCDSDVLRPCVFRSDTSNLVNFDPESRRTVNEILPGLFLGHNYSTPEANIDDFLKLGITDVIIVRHEVEAGYMTPLFPMAFRYYVVEFPGADGADVIGQMPKIADFVDLSIAQNGRVLVYCSDGISRGPSVVIGYLMYKRGISFEEALNFVKRRRSCVKLTLGLENQLREYGPICQARRMIADASAAGVARGSGQKRSSEEGNCTPCKIRSPSQRVARSDGFAPGANENAFQADTFLLNSDDFMGE